MTAKEKIPPFAWKTIRKQENNFICCTVSNPIKIYQFWGWFCLNNRRQTPVSSCLSPFVTGLAEGAVGLPRSTNICHSLEGIHSVYQSSNVFDLSGNASCFHVFYPVWSLHDLIKSTFSKELSVGGVTFLTDAASSTSCPHTVTCKALRRSSVQFSRLVIFTVTSVPVGVCRARWTEVRLSNPLPGIRHTAHGSNQSRKKSRCCALQQNLKPSALRNTLSKRKGSNSLSTIVTA